MHTRTIHVALYDTWADWEAAFALAHLASGDWRRDGSRYRIVTVGAEPSPITTKGGLSLTPDILLDELDPEESDMLILPGADSWLSGGNRDFVAAAERFLDAGVPVAAICGATVGLAGAGLLNNRHHTSNAPQLLEGAGYAGHERYRHELAVTDRDLITASGIAPVEFARAIFERLSFYDDEVSANWYLLYGKQDPAGYFGLIEAASHGG